MPSGDREVTCVVSTSAVSRSLVTILFWGVLVPLLAGVALGYWASTGTPPVPNRTSRPSRQAALHIPAEALALGNVAVSKDFRCTIPIENRSNGDVSISRFQASCGCTAIEPSSLILRSGEKAHVYATIDLSSLVTSQDRETPFEIFLRPIVHGVESGPSWKLTGTALLRLTLDATTVQFTGADAAVATNMTVVKRLRGKIWEPGAQVSIPDWPEGLSAEVVGPDSNGQFEVVVAPLATGQCGPFQYTLDLLATDAQGNVLQHAPLKIAGIREPPVLFSPKEIALGALPIGTRVVRKLTFQCEYYRLGDVRLQGIAADASIPIVPQTASDDSATITVAVAVTELGTRIGRLEVIYLEDGFNELVQFTVPITYHGFLVSSPDITHR